MLCVTKGVNWTAISAVAFIMVTILSAAMAIILRLLTNLVKDLINNELKNSIVPSVNSLSHSVENLAVSVGKIEGRLGLDQWNGDERRRHAD